MAAPSAIAAGLLGPAAPPTTTSTTSETTEKTREQILDEIEKLKQEAESAVKVLGKIDTGGRKAVENRDAAVKGRAQIDDLKKRIESHQQELKDMKEPPPTDPLYRTFFKRRTDAGKILANLTKKVDQTDKHLKRSTDTIPSTTATSTDAPAASTEGENSRGLGALLGKLPFGKSKSASKESLVPTTPATAAAPPPPTTTTEKPGEETDEDEEEDEGSEEVDDEEDDEDVISDRKTESKQPSPIIKSAISAPKTPKKSEVASVGSEDDDDDESDDDEDDEDGVKDNRELYDELRTRTTTDEHTKDTNSEGRRSRSPATPRSNRKTPTIKVDSAPTTPSVKSKKSTAVARSPLPPSSVRKKTPSPRRRSAAPATRKRVEESEEEDSYFEEEEDEDEDDDDEELRRLHETGEHEEAESDHDYNDQEEDEPVAANTKVQELRTSKYAPGTQFIVTHDLTGVQTGDLTIHRGETLILVEQRPDDWWIFKNAQTQQQGVVPINHIQLLPGHVVRRRAKPSTSATVLVDAFKAANNVPAGFIPSDLAPLTQLEEYQLWRALVPKMTESNLAFADLYWRPEVDKIHVHDVTYQKILTLKTCVKIPRIKGEQVRILDRSVRVCLYDGFEIVSNIHTIRAQIPKKIDERDLTEDWYFAPNDINTLIDEQSHLLIRSNPATTNQRLNLLFELSQWCQSTVTQEKCEVACGWTLVPLQDEKPPLISDTKGYNELLRGGHIDETNVLLDPQYKILRSDGLSGKIDRIKRARIKFSIESRETDIDLLYDNLPIQSMIVPLNLIKTVAFFRNELAYQIYKRRHPTGLSTTPIDSIFLSTFFQALQQPDLIYALRRVYRSRQRLTLSSSSSAQQRREEFIRTYELFIYPLLHYRQLPPYDFHDTAALNERRKLISDMIKRQLPNKKTPAQDILSILLDPNLTDKWTPFTTEETSFALQKYIQNFKSDIVA
ncbi:hypothetical protein I4U23_014181 [Adineta vaga]|nr:hypothetical protein I4U23_014181 [Adineta vaga]